MFQSTESAKDLLIYVAALHLRLLHAKTVHWFYLCLLQKKNETVTELNLSV